MTRTPAPADDAHLDQALREVAEQWRLDFTVPPMPLLENASRPSETRASGRARWTRPVLVAASIVALGAVTAAVISIARPTDHVAGPPSPTPPTNSAAPISSGGPASSSPSTSAEENPWPAQGLLTLDVIDGIPPRSFTVGSTVMTLQSVGTPSDLVTDSDHPTFIGVGGHNDVGSSCGTITRIYLQRKDAGAVTVVAATYRFGSTAFACGGAVIGGGILYGSAPYPISGVELLSTGERASISVIDLADFRAPRYLPSGYALGLPFSVSAPWKARPRGAQVSRVLTAYGNSQRPDIRLTWLNPEVDPTTAPTPSVRTQVIRCATRMLGAGKAVTACISAIGPQQAVSTAELQRVVDSIPD